MGLGPNDMREILIRIGAIDEASPVFNKMGANVDRIAKSFQLFGRGMAFQRVGQALEDVGKKMLGVSRSAVTMAMDFDKGMASVQTQAQLGAKAFDRLSSASLASAGRYGQGFETINQGLYDIFSSTELNGQQAIKVVNKFAEAATAGGSDVRTVSRSAIATMNAYGLSADSITGILDNQFQAVRKGVFTYEEFASAIGNLLPYGASADQTLQNITGSMAFMSRNGFTASQSAISVARALDQLMRNRGDIKDVLGIDVVDKATGDYKSLNQIMAEFAGKMKNLTGPQIQGKLEDIFGAGEIRANRFFRLAIPRQAQLNDLIHQMGGSNVAGQMDKAFKIMKRSPAVQWQILIERVRGLAVMLGEALLPVLQDFIKFLMPIVKTFKELSPETKKWIAIGFTLAGVIIFLSGATMKLYGSFLLLRSILMFTGTAIGSFLSIGAIWIAVIAAVVIAAWLLYKNWDKVKAFLIRTWNILKDVFNTVWGAIKTVASAIGGWVMDYIVRPFMVGYRIYAAIWKAIFRVVMGVWGAIWNFIKGAAKWVMDYIVTPFMIGIKIYIAIWKEIFKVTWAVLQGIWNVISTIFVDIWHVISGVVDAIVVIWKGFWALFWGITKGTLTVTWAIIKTVFQIGFKIIVELIKFGIKWWQFYWHILVAIWHTVGVPLMHAIVWIWKNVLWPVIKSVLNFIRKEWDILWTVVSKIWNTVGRPIFNAVKTAFKAVWDFLVGAFNAIKDHWSGFWTAVKDIFFGIINGILTGIESFVNAIIDAINWVRTKFGLDAMGHVVLSRVGGESGGGTGGGHGHGKLAKGTANWQGGWAMVGERGPEMAFLPRGAAVIPNNYLPGFAGGLLSSAVVSKALSATGVHMPALPGIFNDIGPAIVRNVIQWFQSSLAYVLGGPRMASGGHVQHSGWAYLHGGENVQSARTVRNLRGANAMGELHIHIEPQKAIVDERELIAEVDWIRRTRGW